MDEFHAAPWPPVLKVSSAVVTLLVGAVEYGAFLTIPPHGAAHVVGVLVVVALPLMLLLSILFVVTGFAIDHHALYIRRMLWTTRVELSGLRRIWLEPDAIKGSIRLYGNGGLFSFSGIYRSKKLGRYRLFATDPACAVVMVHSAGTVVVTPANPPTFIERVRLLYPSAQGPHEESRSTPDRRTHSIS